MYMKKINCVDMTVVKANDVANLLEMLQRLDLEKFEVVYLAIATLLARLRRLTQNTQVIFQTPPMQTTAPMDLFKQVVRTHRNRQTRPASRKRSHTLKAWL
jgi:hypothetical protein